MTDVPAGFEHINRFRGTSSVLEGDGRAAPPTDAELAQHLVSPGEEALLPLGILYQAGWEPLADGMARHAREQVRALSQAGFPVSLRSLPMRRMRLDDEIDPDVLRQVGYLRATSIGHAPMAIRQAVIPSYAFLEALVCPAGGRLSGFEAERSVYASTIVYTSWERTTVHPEIVEVLNRCAATWVPCRANRVAFHDAGVKNVFVIPCPYDPNTNLASQIPEPRGLVSVPGGKRFYAIGKWEPRKNYHALIGAFLIGFKPTEQASLFLKTSEWGTWEGYPTVGESVAHWLDAAAVRDNGWTEERFRQRVRIVTKSIPEEKIQKLHRDNNIYVTCSHGEAWDMPAFDARCAGNRLVFSGYGGAEDYAGNADTLIAQPGSVGFEPVHPGYGWEADAEWLRVPVESIVIAMRSATPPSKRLHPPELFGEYGVPKVGRMMRASIAQVLPEALKALDGVGGFG